MFSKLQHKVSENVTTLLKGGWGGGGGERSRSDLLKTVFHCPCSIFCHFYVSLQEFCKIKKKNTHAHTQNKPHMGFRSCCMVFLARLARYVFFKITVSPSSLI